MILLRLIQAFAALKIAVSASAESSETSSFRNSREESQRSLRSSPHESNGYDRWFPSENEERHLQSSQSSASSSSFYNSYDHYAPYCAVPSQMEERSIPPLRDYLPNNDASVGSDAASKKSLVGETRLVHVTAIVRHGARTPWSSEMKCWNGYWESEKTGKWDCDDLTTFLATPSRNGSTTRKGGGGNTDSDTGSNGNGNGTVVHEDASGAILFEKKYDALSFPDEGLTNVLNGTCEMGQLIQQGYEQQIRNGQILRDAYAYRKGEYDHDERMRLLNIRMGENDPVPWQHPSQLYFRADDYQRTVMSGQILLRSLFDPELAAHRRDHPEDAVVIPLHIADEDKDVMDANEKDCPRLRAIKEEAMSSPEYQAFNSSDDSQEVREYLQAKLGMGEDASVLDCMMCTMCTDRPLPSPVDDYDGSRSNWFTKATEYWIQKDTLVMKHNNAEHSKLAMGPLWYEIMKNINDAVSEKAAPKLALFAGHDTTLMPLLASLGPELWKEKEWAPYASMMLIEIHELIDGRPDPDIYTSKFAFRLLFNGKILTPLIDGCHEDCELCDIVHFKAIVDPFATRDADCSVSTAPSGGQAPEVPASSSSPASPTGSSSETKTTAERIPLLSMSTTAGMVVFATLVILSGFGGSAITFAVMRKSFVRSGNGKPVDYGVTWNDDADIGSGDDGE